ncbi:phosphatase PAP2 family protein [Schnuerera sp. xch1]|uniref:phosphatase PAP2 family protein n=1 Tax=Schnuerera sp. xch1 TaxID=2874283 RepID=UPI001CBC05E4|nr:phosphatase PAP2 family protein [Schnuerera sp. xch1]MBZ2174226.1 phosphatase PAP2 family protein [Schnuerera sp. xch1]
MKNRFKWFDEKLIKLINDKMKSKFLDKVMLRITNLGSVMFIFPFIFVLIILGNKEARTIGTQSAITLCISQTITYSLKSLLSRERPYNILKNLNTFGIILKDYSFPSGHTSASFSVATIIVLNIPELSLFAISIAFLIGISRIYLGVHYPTDVVAGIIIGVGSGIIVYVYLITYVRHMINFF